MIESPYKKIQHYQGSTFVAYLDISGFKSMMKKGEARDVLNKFYSTIFQVGEIFRKPTRPNLLEVDAIVVSDCAVLFSRIEDSTRSKIGAENNIKGLQSILEFIRRVNSILINPTEGHRILTTCSIDYGKFKYEDRIDVSNMKEVFFIGEPYVNAFLDNEFGEPKILPGQ